MSIQFTCSGCDNTLRVSDAYAGMNAQCPKCGAETRVPGPQAAAQATSPAAGFPLPDTNRAEPDEVQWQMQTAEGKRFGPVSRTALDKWRDEGRIDASCKLYCDGWDEWKPASVIYPQFANQPTHAFGVPTQSTPVRYPSVGAASFQYLQPHRGPLVLTLGILGLTFCQLLAVPAWIMGRSDLAAMREGRMDPSGEGVTQAGHICGIFGSVIMLAVVLFYGVFLLFIVFLGAAGAAGS